MPLELVSDIQQAQEKIMNICNSLYDKHKYNLLTKRREQIIKKFNEKRRGRIKGTIPDLSIQHKFADMKTEESLLTFHARAFSILAPINDIRIQLINKGF